MHFLTKNTAAQRAAKQQQSKSRVARFRDDVLALADSFSDNDTFDDVLDAFADEARDVLVALAESESDENALDALYASDALAEHVAEHVTKHVERSLTLSESARAYFAKRSLNESESVVAVVNVAYRAFQYAKRSTTTFERYASNVVAVRIDAHVATTLTLVYSERVDALDDTLRALADEYETQRDSK